MNQILNFLENKANSRKAKFVGFIAALCGIFLSIPVPEIAVAKNALGAIQLFWFVILTLSLTSLFVDLLRYVWHEERTASKKYDIPFESVVTAFIGVILGAVI
ncbi:MAG: hypothetical protein WA082_00340, partial [Candidatus Moraniibacteriota bacterium]